MVGSWFVVSLAWLASAAAAAAGPGRAVSVTELLKTARTWNGAPIVYSGGASPEVNALIVEVAPSATLPWHQHPVVQVAYVLEGSIRVELDDATVHDFKAGEAFAEVVGTWHRGVNVGPTPAKILVVCLGGQGVPVSQPRSF